MSTMLQKFRFLTKSVNSKQFLLICSSSSFQNDRPASASLSLRLNSNDTAVAILENEEDNKPKERISKAMRAYLERARVHDEFMKKQQIEFQIGKRHLANMMGIDADTMTQEDIDKSIAYLFPSGLFEPRARPLMKPPEQVFPQRKAAEFDEMGRPHHFLFYTMSANFYQIMHDAVLLLEQLNREEDAMIRKKGQVDPGLQMETFGSEWITKDTLELITMEKITDPQYTQFQAVLARLMEHPLSVRVRDFMEKFRKPLLRRTVVYEIPKPSYDNNGRAYVTIKECLRKRARGEVTVHMPGSGLFSINGSGINYFADIQAREQVYQYGEKLSRNLNINIQFLKCEYFMNFYENYYR